MMPHSDNYLAPTKKAWQLKFGQNLDLEYAQTKRFSDNLSLKYSLTSSMFVINESDLALNFYSQVLWRVRLFEQFKVYAGLMYGTDGCTALVGFKLAGIKLLIPWTDPVASYVGQGQSVVGTHLALSLGFLAASFGLNKYTEKERKREIEAWIENECNKLY